MGNSHLHLLLSVKPARGLLCVSAHATTRPEHSLHPGLLKSTMSFVNSVTSSECVAADLESRIQRGRGFHFFSGTPPLPPKPKLATRCPSIPKAEVCPFFLRVFMYLWAEWYFPNIVSSNPGSKHQVVTDISEANAGAISLHPLFHCRSFQQYFYFLILLSALRYSSIWLSNWPYCWKHMGPPQTTPACALTHLYVAGNTGQKSMGFLFSSQNFKMTRVAEWLHKFLHFWRGSQSQNLLPRSIVSKWGTIKVPLASNDF